MIMSLKNKKVAGNDTYRPVIYFLSEIRYSFLERIFSIFSITVVSVTTDFRCTTYYFKFRIFLLILLEIRYNIIVIVIPILTSLTPSFSIACSALVTFSNLWCWFVGFWLHPFNFRPWRASTNEHNTVPSRKSSTKSTTYRNYLSWCN